MFVFWSVCAKLGYQRYERQVLTSNIASLVEPVVSPDTRPVEAVSVWALWRALRERCFVLFLYAQYLPSCE